MVRLARGAIRGEDGVQRRRPLVHHAVFQRGPRDYVAERLRLRYFPAMAKRIPELRETFFWRRLFLTPRSAAFDAALAGVALAAVARRPWPLALAVPYARLARRRPRAFAVDVVADAVGLGSLLAGSARGADARPLNCDRARSTSPSVRRGMGWGNG